MKETLCVNVPTLEEVGHNTNKHTTMHIISYYFPSLLINAVETWKGGLYWVCNHIPRPLHSWLWEEPGNEAIHCIWLRAPHAYRHD